MCTRRPHSFVRLQRRQPRWSPTPTDLATTTASVHLRHAAGEALPRRLIRSATLRQPAKRTPPRMLTLPPPGPSQTLRQPPSARLLRSFVP